MGALVRKISLVLLGIIIVFLFVLALVDISLTIHPISINSEEQIPSVIKKLNPTIVKVGQIWISGDRKDPFQKDSIYIVKVLDIKDGYLQWCFIIDCNIKFSDKVDEFVSYRYLIGDPLDTVSVHRTSNGYNLSSTITSTERIFLENVTSIIERGK